MRRELVYGMAAGAAGTTALDAVTYLDMALRGRPPSTMPEESVERISKATHIPLGDERAASNRKSGLAALLGIATGVGVCTAYAATLGRSRRNMAADAALLGLGAMAVSNAPMTAFGLTDPRQWKPADWVADVLPHAAFGLAAAGTLAAIRDRDRGRRTWSTLLRLAWRMGGWQRARRLAAATTTGARSASTSWSSMRARRR